MISVTEEEVAIDPVDYAQAKINKSLSSKDKIGLLREMLRIRRFEQVSLKFYNQGVMGGFLHLYIGQEAVAVGTISLMETTIMSSPPIVIMVTLWPSAWA